MSSPWFKFYASDFLAGTSGLTAAERGVYITLLALMYEQEGPVPLDRPRLARRCGIPAGSFKRVLDALIDQGKIIKADDCLYNMKAKTIIGERQKEITTRQSGARKTNAILKQKKQQKQGESERSPVRSKDAIPDARVRGDSFTNVQESKNTKKVSVFDDRFEAIWDRWRNHFNGLGLRSRVGSKAKALERWNREAKHHGVEAVEAFCLAHMRETDAKYVKGLVPLLNTGGAENYVRSKAEPEKPKPKAIPEWKREGYDSEQHWIDCDRGNIAPHAVNGVLIPDRDPYQVLAS